MKAKDALIAWTSPNALDVYDGTRGQVCVGPLIQSENDRDWSAPYACTGGAANIYRRDLSEWQQIAHVFIDFQSLVVGYGLSPNAVHEAFLNIDEYAQRIAPDQPGARPLPGEDDL